ncbi:hypothetical protein GG851_27085 [Bordetella petrii]|nr:hypothetical protein [Bordetella petrii]
MNTQASPLPSTLRFRPNDIDVSSERPFENDKLDREPFVTATVDLLQAIREPFVIALNAPWGSGKTTTLRLLEPALNQANISTVRFNAWEVDDAIDPLVPLVAELHDRLLRIKGFEQGINHSKVQRLKTLGSAVAKHGTIAMVKAASAGLLDLGEASEGIAKAVENAGEGLAGDLIDAFKQEKKAAEQFQKLLIELSCHARGADDNTDSPPLVLMIDELDRCRPTFAISMLERIKHFFHIPGLVFLLALDMKQLKSSTRKVYGAELDATEYLRRFVDLELSLPAAKPDGMIDAMLSNCGADDFFNRRGNNGQLRDERKWIVSVLTELATCFGLSLRVLQRMVSRLMLVIRQTSDNSYLDPILVAFMIFLRIQDDTLLQRFVAGQARADEVMKILRTEIPGGRAFYDSHVGMVIEAYMLYAHNQRHDYVSQFLKKARDITDTPETSEHRRILEVTHRFDNICQEHFARNGIDLRAIDQRINLVAMGLRD